MNYTAARNLVNAIEYADRVLTNPFLDLIFAFESDFINKPGEFSALDFTGCIPAGMAAQSVVCA